MPAPLIAVPCAYLAAGKLTGWRPGGFAVPETYVAALRRAGARPVLLTAPEPAEAEEVLAPFDGLLLAGGGDLQPQHYDGENHPAILDVEPDRDALELGLAKAAHNLGMPVLGICRGMQAMNVAFGGTLHPHLPDLGLDGHGDPDGGGAVEHQVRIEPGTRLAQLTGTFDVHGIARHHQAVRALGAGLVATAWTEDGCVEGLERTDSWMVGVQWHPEVTAGTDPANQGLFDGLVAAARNRLAPARARLSA